MDYSTPVTEVLVKEVLKDSLKVILDNKLPNNQLKDTGEFTLIFGN